MGFGEVGFGEVGFGEMGGHPNLGLSSVFFYGPNKLGSLSRHLIIYCFFSYIDVFFFIMQ